MTQEEKQILLKDLCARLPYGVKLRYVEDLVVKKESHVITLNNVYLEHILNGDADIKPYLRPMSSMTEEEKEELKYEIELELQALEGDEGHSTVSAAPAAFEIDFYNKHQLDYRGLIEKRLAIEAPENMYKEN